MFYEDNRSNSKKNKVNLSLQSTLTINIKPSSGVTIFWQTYVTLFNNFTFPNNHILTLIRIQFQFCIPELTLNRGQNIIKCAMTEGRT